MGLHHLERTLSGFRAAVGEKSSLQTAHLGDALRKRSLVFVVKKIGSMNQPSRLLLNDADDPRVVLAEGVHADTGDEIEIALTRGVPHPGAVAANQNERMARVTLEQIPALEFDD